MMPPVRQQGSEAVVSTDPAEASSMFPNGHERRRGGSRTERAGASSSEEAVDCLNELARLGPMDGVPGVNG